VNNQPMRIVGRSDWFRVSDVGDGITLIEEPNVHGLLSANIWHVRGRDRDLVVDSGLGIVSLRAVLPTLFDRDPVLVLTHAHLDHMGGAHEFEDCRVHTHEAGYVRRPGPISLATRPLLEILGLSDEVPADEQLPDLLLTAVPDADYDPTSYALAAADRAVEIGEGDVIDLGDRALTVMHLPGHTAGSIGLFDADAGQLFTGDVIYEGGLIDACVGSDVADYISTMRRLLDVPVERAFPGHGRILDRQDLHGIARDYITSRTT
jgi:glyoxylase-like metal-dependent hydrolase (beta-lactamase superfamily II)